MRQWRFRVERAIQLGRDGQWQTIAERLKRKLTPRGEPPEAQDDPRAYARWLRRHRRTVRAPAAPPVPIVSCVLPSSGQEEALRAAWREARKKGAWLVVALPGTGLARELPAWISAAAKTGARVVTFDHDERLPGGAIARPFFKPGPSPLRLRFQPYVLPAFALAPAPTPPRLRAKTPEALLHALALATVGRRPSRHLPVVLATAARAGIADARLETRTPSPDPRARVSILIPFRDKPELLERCLETLFEKTRGVRFDVWLLDNDSREEATRRCLARWQRRTQRLSCPGPFNFAAINNAGAKRARGSHLLLLNNDTEIIERDWLRALLGFGCEKDVGAVGARLLYPDGSLQHGGVLLGVAGLAAHALSGYPGDAAGHHGEARVPHEVAAVTGACLLVSRRKYWAVGGLDARKFPVAFNDLDLCMKLATRGWRTIYNPDASLVHHESRSRGSRVSVAEDRAFEEAWGGVGDPYLNANFSRLCADFRWRQAPRAR